jgi:hypothetical protein
MRLGPTKNLPGKPPSNGRIIRVCTLVRLHKRYDDVVRSSTETTSAGSPRGGIKLSDAANATLQPDSTIPADDPNRKLTVANPDSSKVRHVAVVGGTYSFLVSGAQTAGR